MIEGPLYRLVQLLKDLVDHLLGVSPRTNYRRLFLSTCRGKQCPELDRLGVKAAEPIHEFSGKQPGFWCPMWAWPYMVKAMQEHHEAKQRAKALRGKEGSPTSTGEDWLGMS